MPSRGRRKAIAARKKAGARARALYVNCPKCGKRAYPTEHIAADAILGSAGKAGRRIYECAPGSNLWHVSSDPRAFRNLPPIPPK